MNGLGITMSETLQYDVLRFALLCSGLCNNDPLAELRHLRLCVAHRADALLLFLFSPLSTSQKSKALIMSRKVSENLYYWVSHAIFAPCLYVRSPISQAPSVFR